MTYSMTPSELSHYFFELIEEDLAKKGIRPKHLLAQKDIYFLNHGTIYNIKAGKPLSKSKVDEIANYFYIKIAYKL